MDSTSDREATVLGDAVAFLGAVSVTIYLGECCLPTHTMNSFYIYEDRGGTSVA